MPPTLSAENAFALHDYEKANSASVRVGLIFRVSRVQYATDLDATDTFRIPFQ